MNRAGLTRMDKEWGEWMLNQGGSYIWNGLRGGEGNARDPLSFVMPLMFNKEADGLAQLRSVVQVTSNTPTPPHNSTTSFPMCQPDLSQTYT